jgi:hypothetical protein
VSGFPGHDAQYGRDVTDNDPSDGYAGFSFTKLDQDGNALPAGAPNWACIQDNVTGLIWEAKTTDGALHDWRDTFSWYDPNPITNGGNAGYRDSEGGVCFGYDSGDESTYCNTHAFVNRVNLSSLCGADDWRIPTRKELLSIIDYSSYLPAMESSYFKNVANSSYWSSETAARFSSGNSAWWVSYGYGVSSFVYDKSDNLFVRLVRGGR